MSKFRVILVRIFSHSDWIRRDTEYVHFSRSVSSQFSQKFCWALLLKWSGFTVTKKYEFYGLSRKSCSFSKFRFYVRNIKNAASDVSETLDFIIIIIIILDFEWRVWIKTHNFNCVYWKLEGHTPSTVVGITFLELRTIGKGCWCMNSQFSWWSGVVVKPVLLVFPGHYPGGQPTQIVFF